MPLNREKEVVFPGKTLINKLKQRKEKKNNNVRDNVCSRYRTLGSNLFYF